MAKFQDYLKNIFWVLLILQFAPPVFKTIQQEWSDYAEPKNKIGLIFLNGCIMSSSRWNKQFKKFFKDPEIKAILIKIESGGGAAGSCSAIFAEILQLKKEYPKPIVAYAENICASGGYQIACAADHIVATGSAVIGSVGAKFVTQFKVKEFLQNYKIKPEAISSGAYKNCTDPFADFTDDQKKMLQEMSDDCYEHFAQDIAQCRHLNMANKNIWAEGKIFTGNEALKLKLIDELGNQTTAIDFVKKQILHADREIELVKIPAPSKWQQWLHPDSEEDDDDMQCSFATSFWQSLFNFVDRQGIRF
jgi:protease IV